MELKQPYKHNSSAEECLRLLFNHTKQGGSIDIFDWALIAEPEGHGILVLDWSDDDCCEITKQFAQLDADLRKLAEYADRINGSEALAVRHLSQRLFGVWRTYLMGHNSTGISASLILGIIERLDIINDTEILKQKLAAGEVLDFKDWQFLQENRTVRVSPAEQHLLDRYHECRAASLKQRFPKPLYADFLVLYAQWLCELYRFDAPDEICRTERQKLAIIMAVNAFGREVECP